MKIHNIKLQFKHLALSLSALALVLTSCDYNERNFDIEEGGTTETQIFTLKKTLSAADYAAIAKNSTNKEIAENQDQSDALNSLAKDMYFTKTFTAARYVPQFLAETYFAADNGSAIKVTYNLGIDAPEYITALKTATNYVLNGADYAACLNSDVKYFSPSNPANQNVGKVLNANLENITEGQIVHVEYREATQDPNIATASFINEGFNYVDPYTTPDLADWTNVTTEGTGSWSSREHMLNNFIQTSAFGQADTLSTYLISPKFTASANSSFTLDFKWGQFKTAGGRLSIVISEDFVPSADKESNIAAVAAATWVNITDSLTFSLPEEDNSNYAPNFMNVGIASLEQFAGKDVRFALRYDGNGATEATTTFQVDNIKAYNITTSRDITEAQAKGELMIFNDNAWKVYDYKANNLSLISDSEYLAMGLTNGNFSSTTPAENYLAQYVASKNPIATEGSKAAVSYLYYDGSVNQYMADEFIFTDGAWTLNNNIVPQEDQFVKNNDKWVYDPSIIVNLPNNRDDALGDLYYQTMVDWVWENVDVPEFNATKRGDAYVTSYGNNDYYTGASAYYNNADWRPAKCKETFPDGFKDESGNELPDETIAKLLQERFIKVLGLVLPSLNPDLKYIEGVNVKCTINFVAYNGEGNVNYTLAYAIQEDGSFLYIEDSLQIVE